MEQSNITWLIESDVIRLAPYRHQVLSDRRVRGIAISLCVKTKVYCLKSLFRSVTSFPLSWVSHTRLPINHHQRRGKKPPHLREICHTYPTMTKLGTVEPYLKKIQKIYESSDTPLEFC